jgi:hypothetical protein
MTELVSHFLARILEMLLNDVSINGESAHSKPGLSLDQIIIGTDPLDDILHHLTGAEKKPFSVDQIITPLPSRQFDEAPSGRVDTNYLDLLNDILVNSGGSANSQPDHDVPEDIFSSILADVIKQKDQMDGSSDALPPMPLLSQVEKPSLNSYGESVQASRVTTESVDINYLDLLDEMMDKKVPPSTGANSARSADIAKSSKEDLLDKLIRSQDQKLSELLEDFNRPDPKETGKDFY